VLHSVFQEFDYTEEHAELPSEIDEPPVTSEREPSEEEPSVNIVTSRKEI